jgi:H+/Cl- antiporter ClcA
MHTRSDLLIRQLRRAWHRYGVFWLGAVAVGLVAVLYARLIDWGYALFTQMLAHGVWLPLLVTPALAALCTWLTRRYFAGAEGSGIPQVIAMLHGPSSAQLGERLLTLRILAGKIALSFLAILGGFTIGREGPTVQVGAALMFNMRRFYRRSNGVIERQLALAGAAAGLSAAFNTPLAGVVFAIEELTRSFSARASGVLITAIIIAGVIALGMNGNYTYFGTIEIGPFPRLLVVAVLVTAVVTGLAGAAFAWLVLHSMQWLPAPLRQLRTQRPVAFAAACGLAIALTGLISGGSTYGSGYDQARSLLDVQTQLPVLYPFLKMLAMVLSYLPGIPGGIFAPSLSIGAGFGNLLHAIFGGLHLPMLIALAMVGYLAAVTQAPITSFVIVMEMINGHALVISLMATALISSRISALIVPPFYETIAHRYLREYATPPDQTPKA